MCVRWFEWLLKGVIVLKMPKLQMKGPSRMAMFLLTCGVAMAAMLVWVLQSQGQLIDAFEVSGPFVAAWAAMITLSWFMLFLFRQATKVGGVPSALYIVFGVADFVLLAAAVALSVWSLLPGLPAGSLFSGGEYGLQVMSCSLLIVAGCLWDLLAVKFRARPTKVPATVLPAAKTAARTEVFEPAVPAYAPQPSSPPQPVSVPVSRPAGPPNSVDAFDEFFSSGP